MPAPDPVLPLLWRTAQQDQPVRRGPRQKVTLDQVLDTAIGVADADGLAAVSMRALAQRLGLGAMSLYTYVPGRDDLIVLMVDQALGRTERPAHPADPRHRVRAVAESAFAEYLAHPWLLELDGVRTWLGPHVARRYEWQLGALDGLGLTDVEMDQAVRLLEGIAAAAVRSRHNLVSAERRSGRTELEWWHDNTEAYAELARGLPLPLASRVGRATGDLYQAASDPDRQFRFSLECVLAGLLGGARNLS